MQKVKLSALKSSPIRQIVLPAGFIERVLKYKKVLREVETTSLEETVSNFQRDIEPAKELELWERMAAVYSEHLAEYPNLDIEGKKGVFAEILKATVVL